MKEIEKIPQNHDKNPFSEIDLYIQPDSNARKTADNWFREGRIKDADQMMKIAENPTAFWVEDDISTELAKDYLDKTQKTKTLALFTAYNIPGRDSGHYSKGGAATGSEYKEWVTEFAKIIDDKKAVIVLEPDALGLDSLQNKNTYSLLHFATEVFEKQPNTSVYIEAPAWVDPDTMAKRLKLAGIEKAQGFALNVSAHNTTEDMIKYGNKVSSKVGGKHFIIDTSRNGKGPYDATKKEPWCNPPGRALGEKPTHNTGHPNADAYLWVKIPGESDGTCRGGPVAGEWWPEYALELAKNASY